MKKYISIFTLVCLMVAPTSSTFVKPLKIIKLGFTSWTACAPYAFQRFL